MSTQKNNNNSTALIYARTNKIRKMLKSHGAKHYKFYFDGIRDKKLTDVFFFSNGFKFKKKSLEAVNLLMFSSNIL